MIDEALASLPAHMKNEPAQNLEMKDFSPAVGTMPLKFRRAFGTARWRPVFRLHQLRTTRKHASIRRTVAGCDCFIAERRATVKALIVNHLIATIPALRDSFGRQGIA